MNVALTVWEDHISPVLDTARSVVLVEMRNGAPVSRREEALAGDSPYEKAARLRALGVETLVCGAISRPLAELIASLGIQVVPFVSGSVDEVLGAMIAGRVPDKAFSMPGCGCQRQRRLRGQHGCGAKCAHRSSHQQPMEKE